MTAKIGRSAPCTARSKVTGVPRRAIVAAAVGNFVEWFSYGIYGYLAAVLALIFFPQGGSSTALLATFAVFGVSFFAVPLGGVFFGPLGDRIGRQKVLAIVIVLMSASTFLIGALPPYGVIGVAAPLLLTALRLISGFSSGGEPAGAASFLLEYARPGRRGFAVCFWHFSSFLGNAAAGLIVAALTGVLSESAVHEWGWRIPFLLCGPLGAVGLYIRTKMEDTPEFAELADKGEITSAPVRETFVANGRQIAQTAGAVVLQGVVFYLVLVYLQTYLSAELGHSATLASFSTVAANVTAMLVVLPFGALSDRVGRRNQMVVAAGLLVVLAYPLFLLLGSATAVVVVAAHCGLAVLLALFMGSSAAGLPELFPTRVRYTGFAIGFTVPLALFGGMGPAAATYLISVTGSPLAPAFLVIGGAVVGGLATATIPSHTRAELG